MMKLLIATLLVLFCASPVWSCDVQVAAAAFKLKTLTNPWPTFDIDPYTNQTAASLAHINATLLNPDIVCAVQYEDETRQKYHLKTFATRAEAESAGYFVTHQNQCGACSTLQDLSIYLTVNLTAPVRACGMRNSISKEWALECIEALGFTHQCAQIWEFNSLNTMKECFWTCMVSWVTNEPYNKPDGSLNDCLQCDEDKSGPVFKYFSGRSRRNSGIHSEIERPGTQVYNVTHCYY